MGGILLCSSFEGIDSLYKVWEDKDLNPSFVCVAYVSGIPWAFL